MSDFREFERMDFEWESAATATAVRDGRWKVVVTGRALLRKSTIDRIESSDHGTVIVVGNLTGKGPAWSMRVRGDFDALRKELVEE